MVCTEAPARASASALDKYMIPDMPSADEVLPHLRRIDDARWYTNFGPLVLELEALLTELFSKGDRHRELGQIHLTTVVSGQVGLEIGLHALGISRGKKVLLPAVTFTACPLAVQHLGADPVLADVDTSTWTLTPSIARAVANRVRVDAVMPVAIYGVPVPISEWDEFCSDTGIPIIIDAASAVEMQQLPRRGVVAYSLHATKPFGIGEGGALASRDEATIRLCRRCANFGMLERIGHQWGTNGKMSEYHGAVGIAQMARWSGVKSGRRSLLRAYARSLEALEGRASLQPSIEEAVVSSLMISVSKQVTELNLAQMRGEGIAVHRTYLPPLYEHPYFGDLSIVDENGIIMGASSSLGEKRGHMKGSEALRASLVGVPFHHLMGEAEVAAVVQSLERHFCFA